MKVSEAEKLVCPFIECFHRKITPSSRNDGNHPVNINCIASDCMAWIWKHPDYKCSCGCIIRICNGENCLNCESHYSNAKNYKPLNEGYCQRLKNEQ